MRIHSILAIAALTLCAGIAGSASARAQSDEESAPVPEVAHAKHVFGYQDLETGLFYPLVHSVPDVSSPATTGTYVITFSVKVASTFPKGAMVGCEVSLLETTIITTTTPPYSTTSSYAEIGSASVAAGATGATVPCVVKIPYSWVIPTAPSGGKAMSSIFGSYTVTAFVPTTTISSTSLVSLRSESSTLPIAATVPKTTSTSVAVSATL